MACSLLKLGSLEKTVISSLFHSVCTQAPIYCGKNDVICYFGGTQVMRFFDKKRPIFFMMSNWFFDHLQLFFVLTIFWSGAKQRFCFRESMLVLDQNGRIQALGFLARWRLTSPLLQNSLVSMLWLMSSET